MKKLFTLAFIQIILIKISPGFTVSIYIRDATCNHATGFMEVQISGGVNPYTYLWSNGATTNGVYGISPGTMLTVTVTDGVGATASTSATMGNEPNLYEVGIGYAGSHPCEGYCNGQGYVPLDALGGIPPYSGFFDGTPMYEAVWYGQDWLWADNVCWNSPGQVYVQDATGCNVTYYWPPYAIPAPVISDVVVTNACTSNNGSAQIIYNEQLGFYLHQWFDSDGGEIALSYWDDFINGLAPGTYTARVTSYNDHIDPISGYVSSTFCSTDTQQFTIHGCDVPTNLITSKITSTTAKLKWTLQDCGIGYKIQYRQSGTTTWTSKSAMNVDYKKLSGLTPNTQYQWRVKTKCGANPNVYSSWSTIKAFTTQLRMSEFDGEEDQLNIFPNPATNQINISISGIEQVEVIDQFGKVISMENFNPGSKTTMIDVSRLESGVYFLFVSTTDSTFAAKFLKQ